MKKWLSLVFIAGVAVTGLVGCGQDEVEKPDVTDPEVTEGKPTEKVEIKLWHDHDALGEALEALIEEELPHIDIVYEKVTPMGTRTKLELDGPAGIGADVFLTAHNDIPLLLEANMLLPLGDELATHIDDMFLPNIAKMGEKDGDYYTIPYSTEAIGLFYNKTLLEKNGFEVASSFDELKEQAEVYNDVTQNKFLMHFKPGNAYDMHFFLASQGFTLYGPEGNDPEQIDLNSPEVIAGLTELASMKEFFPVPSQDLVLDDFIIPEFAKGVVPYVITGPWGIAEIKEGAEKNGFEFGVTTIPTVNGNEATTFSGNIMAAASAFTEHPDEAREVLAVLTSQEALQLTFDISSEIPAVKDETVIDGLATDPYLSGILEQAANAVPMPNISEMTNYWAPMETALKSVWDELATPEEAALKLEQDYEAAFELKQ